MRDVADLTVVYRQSDLPGEMRIAQLADRQHAIVASWQLEALGYDSSAIWRRVAAGRLHRLHHGVYAVGHTRITLRGRWMAAVLSCGPDGVLSHRAAVALWELRPGPAGPIDVTVPGRGRRGQKGIRIHNARSLQPDDCLEIDGIPVTSIARTLLDYAEVAKPQQLRHGLDAAERRDLLNINEVERLLARSPGRHGVKSLKVALAEMRGPAPWTQSELERRFLGLIRTAGLAEPQANVVVAGFTVDLFWPQARLVAEVDGFGFHKSRAAFERDRRRDAKLQVARCSVVRVTQRRIEQEPSGLLGDLRELLGGEARSDRGV